MKFMKKLGSIALMISLVSLVSCTTKKEVILIENVDSSEKIEARLIYRALISEREFPERDYTMFYYVKGDEIYLRNVFESETTVLNFGKVSKEKTEDGFNKINWEEVVLDSKIIDTNNQMIDKNMKTYKDGRLFNLELSNGIEEVEILSDIKLEDLNYVEKINDDLTKLKNNLIINEKTGELLTISEVNNLYNVFHVEDNKIYVSYVGFKNESSNKAGAKTQEKLEKELKIGYIENGKFNDIFEEMNISIDLKYSKNPLFKERVESIVFNDNKILFSGNINEEYAIWNYNIENKELEKIIDLKLEETSYIEASENFEKIFIAIEELCEVPEINTEDFKIEDLLAKSEEEVEQKIRYYIGNLNNDLKIENLTPIYNENYFMGFSEDGNEIYFLDYKNNLKGKVIEAYKI